MAISTYKTMVPTQSAVRVAGGNAGVAVGNFYIKENGAGSVKRPETAVGVAGDNADVAGCNFYIQENGAGSVKQGPHFSVRKIPIGWYACPQPPQVRKSAKYTSILSILPQLYLHLPLKRQINGKRIY